MAAVLLVDFAAVAVLTSRVLLCHTDHLDSLVTDHADHRVEEATEVVLRRIIRIPQVGVTSIEDLLEEISEDLHQEETSVDRHHQEIIVCHRVETSVAALLPLWEISVVVLLRLRATIVDLLQVEIIAVRLQATMVAVAISCGSKQWTARRIDLVG